MSTPSISSYSASSDLTLRNSSAGVDQGSLGAGIPVGASGAALMVYASTYTNKSNDPAQQAFMDKLNANNLLHAQEFDAESMFHDRVNPPGTPSASGQQLPESKPDDGSLINQGAYKGVPLGYGARTISQSGCALASLTTISNRLNNRSTNLVDANKSVMDAGGFVPGTSDMDIERGAGALGLTATSSRMAATDANVAHAVKDINGGEPPQMAVAQVQYTAPDGKQHKHFVALEQEKDGKISAADPAGGRRIQFERAANGGWQEVPQGGAKGYQMVSVQTFRGNAANRSELAAFQNPLRKA